MAHAKMYVQIRKLKLTTDGQIVAFLTYFEKLSRRSESFAQRNFYRNL